MTSTKCTQWYFSIFFYLIMFWALLLTLQIYCLYILVSSFVVLWNFCTYKCVCFCIYILLLLILWLCLSCFFVCLFCLILICFSCLLVFYREKKESVWIWMGGRLGKIWEELREGKPWSEYNVWNKNLFSTKFKNIEK